MTIWHRAALLDGLCAIMVTEPFKARLPHWQCLAREQTVVKIACTAAMIWLKTCEI